MTYLMMSPGKLRAEKPFYKESQTGILVPNLLRIAPVSLDKCVPLSGPQLCHL